MNSFDLTSEPWLPCERMDGSIVLLSLRDALVQAHELRALALDQPAVAAAVHRFLLTVLHRVVNGPRDRAGQEVLIRAGQFDADAIDAYLETVRDRLDLFHPTAPFGQVRGLTKKFGPDPIDRLEFARSSWGGARELFQHRPDDEPLTFEPARAARALLGHHAFATGGLVRKPGEPTSATAAPNLGTAVVLLLGRNLFETLCANLIRYDPSENLPFLADEDAPSWEQPPLPLELKDNKKEHARPPKGYLDLLSWQSRRIELVVDDEGRVSGFVRAVGQGMSDGVHDPMVAYIEHPKRGVIPVGLRKGRAFWRDSAALFTKVGNGRVPVALRQAAESGAVFHNDGALEMHMLGIAVFGVVANKSRIDATRTEILWAAPEAFEDGDDEAAVEAAVAHAERAVFALRRALREFAKNVLAAGGREADKDDVTNLVKSFGAEASVWSELGEHYRAFLRDLGASHDGARLAMLDACLATADRGLERVLAQSDQSGNALRAAALAEKRLGQELAELRKIRSDLDARINKDAA